MLGDLGWDISAVASAARRVGGVEEQKPARAPAVLLPVGRGLVFERRRPALPDRARADYGASWGLRPGRPCGRRSTAGPASSSEVSRSDDARPPLSVRVRPRDFGSGSTAFGLETREMFLTRRLDYYSCADWLRRNAVENDKILVIGEQRGYYIPADHLPSTVHMPNLFHPPRQRVRRQRGASVRSSRERIYARADRSARGRAPRLGSRRTDAHRHSQLEGPRGLAQDRVRGPQLRRGAPVKSYAGPAPGLLRLLGWASHSS